MITIHSGLPERRPTTENPFDSLESAIAFDVRDWSLDRRDAWIYAIVVGWESDDPDDDFNAMESVAAKHGWDEETVARLRRLRSRFQMAARMLSVVDGVEPDG